MLENNIASLRKEHHDIYAMVKKVPMANSQIKEIQEFRDSIRDRVDTASFEEKR